MGVEVSPPIDNVPKNGQKIVETKSKVDIINTDKITCQSNNIVASKTALSGNSSKQVGKVEVKKQKISNLLSFDDDEY